MSRFYFIQSEVWKSQWLRWKPEQMNMQMGTSGL